MSNVVAIVGRPNVGKSTLFNRFLKEKKAIVHEIEGVTRDRVYSEASWNGQSFTIIDTGGIMLHPKDMIDKNVKKQALIASEEADLILFIVDATAGITNNDMEIARILKKSGKPILLVANKVDNYSLENNKHEFYSLGLGEAFNVSAISGRNSGDLLDEIVNLLPKNTQKKKKYFLNLSLLGMPNAGKSTFANSFLGTDRHIVTDIPGTTRDSIDSQFVYNKKKINIIDTAGLRRKSKITDSLEYFSFVRTQRAISKSDICIFIIDINKGFVRQDINLINLIIENRKGLIVVFNKWDLVEKDEYTADEVLALSIAKYPFLKHYPIFFTSAIDRHNLLKVLNEALLLQDRKKIEIKTNILNKVIGDIIKRTPPHSIKGKNIKIKYITQLKTNPPLFAFFCNAPELITVKYKRFLENKLREKFNFNGVPLGILFKKK
ncbi:MAG: ribosome biogenesis GTPase Der [Candidatus Marinimicrobia bacterium]|nr:ribosome biogenesis GTPase Der [Candidatus Neomarinimicrobiota bacterium]